MNRIYRKNMISVVLLFALLFSNLTPVFASTSTTGDLTDQANTQTQVLQTTETAPAMVIDGSTSVPVQNENEKVSENAEEPVVTIPENTASETEAKSQNDPLETSVGAAETSSSDTPGIITVSEEAANELAKKPEMGTSESVVQPTIPIDNKVIQTSKILKPVTSLSKDPVLDGIYSSDPGSKAIPIVGVSINNHTIINNLWLKDGSIYMAIKSTHPIADAKIGGKYGLSGTKVAEHDERFAIKLDGKTLDLSGLKGDTKDARWTVFSWPVAQFDEADSKLIYVNGIGGGHDVSVSGRIQIFFIEISASKVWIQGSTVVGPVKVQLTRKIDSDKTAKNVGKAKTLSSANGWTVTWEDASKATYSGQNYIYDVVESDIPDGFNSVITSGSDDDEDMLSFIITNTYTSPEISVKATKVWKGGTALATPITIELSRKFKDGRATLIDSQSLNRDNNWTYTWADEALTDSEGNPYIYSVQESGVPVNFTSEISTTIDRKGNIDFTITNTFEVPVINVQVTKFWAGGSVLTNPITVELTRKKEAGQTEFVESEILNLENDWFKEWKNMPKTDPDGNDYYYELKEINVPEHFTSETTREEDEAGNITFIITNTYLSPSISVNATKKWVNGATLVKLVHVELTRKIEGGAAGLVESQALNAENSWTYSWPNLDRMDGLGNSYIYELNEIDAPVNFTSIITKTMDETGNLKFKVTNRFTSPLTDIEIHKKWMGGPETKPAITINLLADGVEIREIVLEDDLEFTFKGLKVMRSDGTVIIYTITEDPAAGYKSTISGLTVTNNFDEGLREIPVKKTWIGGPDKKPAITINLKADGVEVSEVILEDDLEFTFKGLPMMKSDGAVINYTITEDPVTGYKSAINGFTVTNDFDEGERDIPVNKVWIGGPLVKPSITINLMADGKDVDSAVLENGTTEYNFQDVPVYNSDGTTILYAISENFAPGYISSIEGFTATNNFDEGTRDITVTKVWEGGTGPRTIITINLLADGVEAASVDLPAGDTEHTFIRLPVYNSDGTTIIYTLTEDPAENYETVIEGFMVFNTWNGELPYTGAGESSALPLLGLFLALGGLSLFIKSRNHNK